MSMTGAYDRGEYSILNTTITSSVVCTTAATTGRLGGDNRQSFPTHCYSETGFTRVVLIAHARQWSVTVRVVLYSTLVLVTLQHATDS